MWDFLWRLPRNTIFFIQFTWRPEQLNYNMSYFPGIFFQALRVYDHVVGHTKVEKQKQKSTAEVCLLTSKKTVSPNQRAQINVWIADRDCRSV